MKRLLILFLFLSTAIFAGEKISKTLQQKISDTADNEKILAWIYFTDKGDNLDNYFANPEMIVSRKSIERRIKMNGNGSLDFSDFPVNTDYINQVVAAGADLRQRSKWFNSISVFVTKDEINAISSLPFVKKLDLVFRMKKDYQKEQNFSVDRPKEIVQTDGINSYNYGDSYTQLQQLNVPAVHDIGITGAGVTVCVMDAGFNNLPHQVFNNMNILATWDFVNGDPDVGDGDDMGDGSHGTQTLSTIGGFYEGELIGPAFGADYILAKTENTESETPVEEDNWIAALEWADSIGVDVTSTSLGYIDFDSPYTSYTWEDMDGNTCVITIGADIAAGKGIVVVNSAGNEGYNSSHNTLGAPADGDSVIAIGAVDSDGDRVSFSSVGNTVDGRIKPDLMAMGSGVTVASTWSTSGYTTSSGTSFSCPLAAGVTALLLDFNPNLTPMQVRDILRQTASNSDNPDREYGWGIIDAYAAIQYAVTPDNIPPETISDLQIQSVTSNNMEISWTVPVDTTVGGVVQYDFRFSTTPITDLSSFLNAEQLTLEGTPANPGELEQISVADLNPGVEYYAAVRAADFWENWSDISNILVETTWDAPEIAVQPAFISLKMAPGASATRAFQVSNTTSWNSTLGFDIELTNNTFPEGIVNVSAKPSNSNSIEKQTDKKVNISGGGFAIDGAGGPDTFGYEWIDSNEPDGPDFIWNDISGTGATVTDWEPTSTYSALDEGIAGPFDLGFTFKYYGEEYTQVYFGTNGFISFQEFSGSTFSNQSIPDSDVPNAMIAAVWDDLDGEGGNVYYKQEGNKFIIQYDNWPEYFGSGVYTFQIVLSSSGKVEIFYNSVSGDLEGCTVGIENHSGNDGLNVVSNSAYLENGLAIEFSSEPEWFTLNTQGGFIYNGNAIDIILAFTSEDLPNGFYSMDVVVNSNDPQAPQVVVPVSMNLGMGGQITSHIPFEPGWNLVSVPVGASDMSVAAVFPDATSNAFGFNGTYQMVDMLENTKGYWLKFDNAGTEEVIGTILSGNVYVSEGWNLIGPFEDPVPHHVIASNPPNLVQSNYFGFDAGYFAEDTLETGKGYWVKCASDGLLFFKLSEKAGAPSPLYPETASRLTITDAEGSRAVLYVTESSAGKDYPMPPAPPEGVFDARFSGDLQVADISAGLNEILLSGAKFPVRISSEDKNLQLSGAGFNVNLTPEEPVVISENISSLTVNTVEIPSAFALHNNYPNPFNPATIISFSLPVSSKISVEVYDMLGQRISLVNNETFEAGVHKVSFDGEGFASGIYFYSIKAEGADGSEFSSVKKMMLLK